MDVLLAMSQVGTSAKRVSGFVKGTSERARTRHQGFRWKVENFSQSKSERPTALSLSSKTFDQAYEEQAEAEAEQADEKPIVEAPKHVPGFLPSFPTERTYKSTQVDRKADIDGHVQWLQQQKQRQDAERAVLNLESRVREDEARQKEAASAPAAPPASAANGAVAEATFLPELYSNILTNARPGSGGNSLGDLRPAGAKRKAVGKSGWGEGGKRSKPSLSALHGRPHRLGDVDSAQITENIHASGLPWSILLGDAITIGLEAAAGNQARAKWHDFQRGGWGSSDGTKTKVELDLAEREKIDKAETILKLGVKATEGDLL